MLVRSTRPHGPRTRAAGLAVATVAGCVLLAGCAGVATSTSAAKTPTSPSAAVVPSSASPAPTGPAAIKTLLTAADAEWQQTPLHVELSETMTSGGDSIPFVTMSGFVDAADGTSDLTVSVADLSAASPGPMTSVHLIATGGQVYASLPDRPGKWKATTAPARSNGRLLGTQVVAAVDWTNQGTKQVAGQTLTAYSGTAPLSTLAAAMPAANLASLPAEVRSSPMTVTIGVDGHGRITGEEFQVPLDKVAGAPADLALAGTCTLSELSTVPAVAAPPAADVVEHVTTPLL